MVNIERIKESFNKFMDERFLDAVLKSTHTSWSDNYYHVELSEEGYKIHEPERARDLRNPCVLIPIPSLSNDDYNSEDEMESNFDNVSQEMIKVFQSWEFDYWQYRTSLRCRPGRAPSPEAKKPVTVRLTPQEISFLESQPEGIRGAIQRLIRDAM